MIPFWPDTLKGGLGYGLPFSPVDVRAQFEPDLGEPISRPRTTGAPFIAQPTFTLQDDEIGVFEDFYADDLKQGSLSFAYRDVITGNVRLWKFMGVYSRQYLTKRVATVSASIMQLPGVPWFAPYVPEGRSTVPYFVADYANSVFGIDGLLVAASALPAIEGSYIVERTTTALITRGVETLTAGDIPATAPAGTTKIVGYLI